MESEYEELVKQLSKAMKLSEEDQNKLLKNEAAKLVAMTPYIAMCNDAKRKAASRLWLFMGASIHGRKFTFFDCTQEDTLTDCWIRIDYICPNDPTGDQNIITAARYRLMLLQISDFRKDFDLDKINGKYNPFSDKTNGFNMDTVTNTITRNQRTDEDVDRILPVEKARGGYWW